MQKFSVSIILYYRRPGNNKEERELVDKFSSFSIQSCDTKLSEYALDILTQDLSHNILSKGVELKHLYKLPRSGNYYVMKLWNSINSTKVPVMGSHYKDWVVMQEIDPNSFLCNCTQIASKRANTCDHAKLLSHASGLIKEAPVLDITDGDSLFQFPGKCFLCIAVEIDEPLSPIAALTLANRLVNGCKLITCSLCQKLYGKTVEAHCDHKKILVN